MDEFGSITSHHGVEWIFRYLDTEDDRRALIDDIRAVRQRVYAIAERTPADQHDALKYHGWSLAAMLAHLYAADRSALWLIRLAVVGIALPFPSPALLNRLNDGAARLFRRRVVATTLKGLKRTEKAIEQMILTLPESRFSRVVYHPPTGRFLTVERGLQVYFLFHWQEHLATLESVRGEG